MTREEKSWEEYGLTQGWPDGSHLYLDKTFGCVVFQDDDSWTGNKYNVYQGKWYDLGVETAIMREQMPDFKGERFFTNERGEVK